MLKKVEESITERSEVILSHRDEVKDRCSERSERNLSFTESPFKNEVSKGLRGCGGEGEPAEAQTPSPEIKESPARPNPQPLEEEEEGEETDPNDWYAEIEREREKYADLTQEEWENLCGGVEEAEDISKKPRRLKKSGKPREILRPNTNPNSPFKKKPLFDRMRLECLLNPTPTLSVTTASELFMMLFLDGVKQLVGEDQEYEEGEILENSSYMDPSKVFGKKIYDTEFMDLIEIALEDMVNLLDNKRESVQIGGELIPFSVEPEFDHKAFCADARMAFECDWHPKGPEDNEGWRRITMETFVDFSAPDSNSVIEGFGGTEYAFEKRAQKKLFRYLDEKYVNGEDLLPIEEFIRRFNTIHIFWGHDREYEFIDHFQTCDEYPVKELDKDRILKNVLTFSKELDLDILDIWDIFYERHIVDKQCSVLEIKRDDPIFSTRRIAQKIEVLYKVNDSTIHKILQEVVEEKRKEDEEWDAYVDSGAWKDEPDFLIGEEGEEVA